MLHGCETPGNLHVCRTRHGQPELQVSVLAFGIVFEFPTVIALLSALGIVTKQILKKYRKYAFCAVLILAAIITPTGDPFSLMICSIPIYLLYEFGIIISRKGDEEVEDTEN